MLFLVACGRRVAALRRGARRASGFGELGLSSDVAAAVEALGFAEPTAIQRAAIPQLAGGAAVVALASETGGGKTLAYLLPLIERLKRHEGAHGLCVRRPGRPRALVLTPSPELSRQVGAQLKQLAHAGVGIASCALSQEQRLKAQATRLSGCVDVVVSTPALLLRHAKLGHVALGDVRTVVVDEAEVLLARGPAADVDTVLRAAGVRQQRDGSGADAPTRVAPDGPQAIFASATLTAQLRLQLRERFPHALVLESAGLHRLSPTAKVRWVRIETRDRYRAVIELLTRRGAAGVAARASGSTIVFCNTVGAARACEHALNEAGVHAVSCHGQLPPQRRRDEVDAFVGATRAVRSPELNDDNDRAREAGGHARAPARAADRSAAGEGAAGEGAAGEGARALPVLVATDAASRGLHFERVSLVVMADFPKDMADFLHRAGRTARQGRSGEVSVLVGARDVELAAALRARIEQRLPIQPISAARPGARERDAHVPSNRLERLAALAERRREPHRVGALLAALGAGRAAHVVGGRRAPHVRAGSGGGRSRGAREGGGEGWFYAPGRGRTAMRPRKAPWYLTSGVRFECTGCSKCCKVKGDVWATNNEMGAMAKLLGVSMADFRRDYQARAQTPPGWGLLKADGGPCVFLDGEGKCSIYGARPLQCRAYPFWPEVAGSREAWEAEAVLPDSVKGPGPRWSALTGGCEGLSKDAAWIPGPVAALRQLEYAMYDARRLAATEATAASTARGGERQ